MSGQVATVVRCGDLVGSVYDTLVSIERQTLNGGETVLTTDQSTPVDALDWLRAIAARNGITVVHTETSLPGAVKNAGIWNTHCPNIVCVDAGDRLDPAYHSSCAIVLEDHADVELVTTGTLVLGPGLAQRVARPNGCTLDSLLGNTLAAHGASMFRRTAWDEIGGFEETLSCLDDYEFFLRVLARRPHGVLVDRPLLLHPRRADALVDRWWGTDEYIDAFTTIVDRHADAFAHAVVTSLYEREHALNDVGVQYRQLLNRHNETKSQIDALTRRVTESQGEDPAERVSTIDIGDFRRTSPIARDWGYERGVPIDRYYIERFLAGQATDIRGVVLEVQEADYTTRFGANRVTRSDVVDLSVSNERATVISDLRVAANIPSGTYDCVILTQTLHVIDDMGAVVAECHRILRSDGVLLVTLPCASRVCLEYGDRGDFWRVTVDGARELFTRSFSEADLEIYGRGNVLVTAAFLYGLACHELEEAEFSVDDPYNPLLVTVRAKKVSEAPGVERKGPALLAHGETGSPTAEGAVLLYHRVGTPDSDLHGLSVSAEQFRAHVLHLREHYRPMPLGELIDAAGAGAIPDGAVALSFDDGYLDNYTTASPILVELGMPATFFVTTESLGIDETYEFWWDVLEEGLLVAPGDLRAGLTVELPTGSHRFATATDDQRLAAYWQIYHAISHAEADARDASVRAVATWSRRDRLNGSRARRVTAEELRQLASRPGHEVGAHSVRHLMLPSQPVETQRCEVAESRTTLETVLDQPVDRFAYPFGALDDSTIEAVRAANFRTAVTCEETTLRKTSDLLRLPRLEVTPQRGAAFGGWLRTAFGPSRR